MIYSATPADLRDAVERIRLQVGALSSPKIYHAAVAATILVRNGRMQELRDWRSPASAAAQDVLRADIGWAMRQLFETSVDALVGPDAPIRPLMPGGTTVVLDLLYDAGRNPLTLVSTAGGRLRGAFKMPLDDESWLWNDEGAPSPTRTVEYNPGNPWGQQNGIRCGLPVSVANTTGDPQAMYAVERNECQFHSAGGKCDINGNDCARMDSDTSRQRGKPRLLIPHASNGSQWVLAPSAIASMVDEATGGGAVPLPRSRDLSLVAAWCAAKGQGRLNHSRLVDLLGSGGIRLLTEAA